MRRYALAALVLLTAACSNGRAALPSAAPATASVDVKGYLFAPAALTVKAGTVVTWTERDDDVAGLGAHSVVADDGSFTSDEHLAKGAAYSVPFAKPGTYAYHCGIHNYMTGTVTVT